MARTLPATLAALLLAAGCTGPDQRPVLPEPTGPHGVGSVRFLFTDSSRGERFTADTSDFREVALRTWYPALKTSCVKRLPYVAAAAERKRLLPEGSPLPPGFFDRAANWMSNSYRDAAIPGHLPPFPVVLYSHSYGAGMSSATALMEELASHGYVVVSVGHAFETSHFIRPDGTVRVFGFDNDLLRRIGSERAKSFGWQRALNRTADPGKLDSLVRGLMRARPESMRSLECWVEDIRFAIDRLAEMNDSGLFAGRLDLSRIGVIGHSFGGAASGQACLVEPRIRAGVNLDGLQVGDMVDRAVEVPFLFVHHDNPGAENPLVNLAFFERARDTAYVVLVRGTRHLNFSDLSLPAIADALDLPEAALGPIDGLRCLRVVNDLVLAFFDRHLSGKNAPLLDDPLIAHPELELLRGAPRTD